MATVTLALTVSMVGGGALTVALIYFFQQKFVVKPRPIEIKDFSGKLAADLDKIVAAPIPFRWNGQIHLLKPIDVENFMYSSEQMAMIFERLNGKSKNDKVSLDEVIKMYADITRSVCDTIGEKEIRAMSMAQMRALLQLIYDHVMGRLKDPESGEKKTQATPSPLAQVIS